MIVSWRRIMNKKGVSPIIGVVLISAVLFSILALFFIWRASQEEFQLQRERVRIQQLKLVEGESIEFLTIPGTPLDGESIAFYNNGTAKPTFLHIHVDDTEIPRDNYDVTWDATDPRKGYITFKNGETAVVDESLKVETQLGNLYAYHHPAAIIDLL